MELTEYIRLFRKWLWLIVLAAFLAGGASFITRSRQPNSYQAQTTLMVGSFIESPNPAASEIRLGVDLAQTYAALVTTRDVLQSAIEVGDFPVTVEQLRDMIDTRVVPETTLLVITLEYIDPVLAADMVNEVAQQLVANSPTNLTPEQEAQIELAESEIASLNEQLVDLRQQLSLVNEELENLVNENVIERLQARRSVLVNQINTASSNIAQFAQTIASLRQRANVINIVESAQIPTGTSGTSVLNTVLLGAMVGAALAVGVALLIEYMDDTLKTPDEITQIAAVPVLGTIARFGRSSDTYKKRLITREDPLSPISEAYRIIRTNLLFAGERKPAYVVTSPGPFEGKSVTAANLAVVIATSGNGVLLVDADLRRPKLNEIFDLPNEVGLTTLLHADPASLSIETLNDLPAELRPCIQGSEVPGLSVITTGYKPTNPTEILGSARMQYWSRIFNATPSIDVVIYDTPPTLVVADSDVLSSAVDASPIIVVKAGRTRRGALLKVKEQFEHLNVDIAGAVLNAVDLNEPGYDYGYGTYYYYYYAENGSARRGLSRFWRRDPSQEKQQQ